MAGKEILKGSAISVTVAEPWAKRDRIARRVGSARAAKVVFKGDALYLTISLNIVAFLIYVSICGMLLAGTPEEAITYYQALVEAEIQYFVVETLDAADEETIRLLLEQVVPEVKLRQ
jgi:hypothetical protein